VPHVHTLQVLLFVLKLYLFVAKLLSKAFFLLVQMEENLDVAVQLRLLFSFDDLLDLSLFHHILSLLFVNCFYLFVNLYLDFSFQFSELLSLLSDVLVHSQLHFVEVLLVYFTSLPHGKTLLSF